jgi:hypothetical protein
MNDKFDAINKREFELGAATMASLMYLMNQNGIEIKSKIYNKKINNKCTNKALNSQYLNDIVNLAPSLILLSTAIRPPKLVMWL